MKEPIKNYIHQKYPTGSVTQWYNENPDLYARFGFKAHTGIDIVAPHGEPIMAVESGEVINVKDDPKGFGKHVRIASKTDTKRTYREWGYAHLSAIHVKVGQQVKAGEVIGLMGNTGFVVSGATPFWKHNPYAGTHLHLQCRMIVEKKGGWSYPGSDMKIDVIDYDNGYKGCFDIGPLLSSISHPTKRQQQMLTIISLQKTVISLLEKLIARR